MPQTRFVMLKKRDVEKFIGKAEVNKFVFYLIKWKDHLNQDISWQSTSRMGNMGKFLTSYNSSIERQPLPYIYPDYQELGRELLKTVDEKDEKQKRMWKIQKIIGKRRINGHIYYFMKWKHVSIFESDWIAQHGLWRLYPQQLKQCKASLINQTLPFTDRTSLNDYIQEEGTAFENDHEALLKIYENSRKTKRQKLEVKRATKDQHSVKKEFSQQKKSQIFQQLVQQLKQRFFYPVEQLYLKQKQKAKSQKLQFEETEELYLGQTKSDQEISPEIILQPNKIIKLQHQQNLPVENLSKTIEDGSNTIDQLEIVSQSNSKNPADILLKSEQRSSSSQQITPSHRQVLEIILFAENVPKIISLPKNQQPELQNLYRVILASNPTDPEGYQEQQKKCLDTSKNFYLTSFLTDNYPRELIQYLEKQNARLRNLLNINQVQY